MYFHPRVFAESKEEVLYEFTSRPHHPTVQGIDKLVDSLSFPCTIPMVSWNSNLGRSGLVGLTACFRDGNSEGTVTRLRSMCPLMTVKVASLACQVSCFGGGGDGA